MNKLRLYKKDGYWRIEQDPHVLYPLRDYALACYYCLINNARTDNDPMPLNRIWTTK